MKVGIDDDGDWVAEYYEATVVSAVDYYPFGSAMAGRKYNQGTYRYGFNGKEEDSEWGSQMIQDYGFRIYNPTIGKFLSVDPLTKDYPELTTYQFASNTPIQAIDLDGLEAFFIHGTISDFDRWTHPNEQEDRDETLIENITALSESKTFNDGFSWRVPNPLAEDADDAKNLNHLHNDEADRSVAAKMLVSYVLSNSNKINGKYEKITLIGHSHGGNVSIQAAMILQRDYDIIVDVITIATPAYNDEESLENANGLLGTHTHIYNTIDGIDGLARGDEEYTNQNTINLEVDASGSYSPYEWNDAHSFDTNNVEDFLNSLNNVIQENPELQERVENNRTKQQEYESN
jgi:RHS repeat-associated protein